MVVSAQVALGERYRYLARIHDMPGTLLFPHHFSLGFLMRKLSFSEVANFPRSYKMKVRIFRLALSGSKAPAIINANLPLYGEAR